LVIYLKAAKRAKYSAQMSQVVEDYILPLHHDASQSQTRVAQKLQKISICLMSLYELCNPRLWEVFGHCHAM
jgi:hypothetical protein